MRAFTSIPVLALLLVPAVLISGPPVTVVKIKPAVIETEVASSTIRIDGSRVSVDFELVRKKEHCEVVLKLASTSEEEMTLTHPADMGALAFLLMDEKGNVIAPVQLDKDADIGYEDHPSIKLKPGATLEFVVSKSNNRKELLSFLSDSGRFAYTLEFGKTYRIVGVYRPAKTYGEGVCSPEKVIRFEAHLHEVKTSNDTR